MSAGAEAALRFETYRAALARHAYRMLGERAESEDVVQEAYVRWATAARAADIRDDAAFLRTTVTRLCIDRLRAARTRRETYVGPWLPEPIVGCDGDDPAAVAALADDVSFALLLVLERLSPLERAAFLLHDVMAVPFVEVAQTLGRSEEAVKQLASRARRHVRRPRERVTESTAAQRRLRDRFAAAIVGGDLAGLQSLLTDDVVFVSDHGGKVPSATVPVTGADHVGRLLLGLARKAPGDMRISAASINGAPGFVFEQAGAVVQTLALDVEEDAIVAIYVVRNPDKLSSLRCFGP